MEAHHFVSGNTSAGVNTKMTSSSPFYIDSMSNTESPKRNKSPSQITIESSSTEKPRYQQEIDNLRKEVEQLKGNIME